MGWSASLRLPLRPRPPTRQADAQCRAQAFEGDYESLFDQLAQLRDRLAHRVFAVDAGRRGSDARTHGPGLFDDVGEAPPSDWILPEPDTDAPGEERAGGTRGPVFAHDLMRALDETLIRLAPHLDEPGFEDVLRAWRQHRQDLVKD